MPYLQLLGDVRLIASGTNETVYPSFGKTAALLAYLAVESESAHSRDELCDLLWPGLGSERARSNLRQRLFHLNKLLVGTTNTPSPLVITGQSVRVNTDLLHVDVHRFQNATCRCSRGGGPAECTAYIRETEALLVLYRGPFLSGFSEPESVDFQNWITTRREVYHNHAVMLFDSITQCQLRIGNLSAALRYARKSIDLSPWNEAAYRQLIQVLASSGQTTAALAAYETCCRILKTELNAVPSAQTVALAQSVRDGKIKAAPERIISLPSPTTGAKARVTVLYVAFTFPIDLFPSFERTGRLADLHRVCASFVIVRKGHFVKDHFGNLIAYFGINDDDQPAAQARCAAVAIRNYLSGRVSNFGIGLHAEEMEIGDKERPDREGPATALAAGLAWSASSGRILTSHTVRELAGGDATFLFEHRRHGIEIFELIDAGEGLRHARAEVP